MAPRQLTLHEASERVRIWDINDPRAQRIHQRDTEMICLDAQPFSIVDVSRLVHELEPRYSLPSRKYITENILPQIYIADLRKLYYRSLLVFASLVLQLMLGVVMMEVLLCSALLLTGLQ